MPHGQDSRTLRCLAGWLAVPATPSASSLLSHLGLSGSYGSGPPSQRLSHPTALAAPRLPCSGEGDVVGTCFSSWPLALLLPFAPQLQLLLSPSHHHPWQPGWGRTLPSPPHPALRTRGYPQAHSSSQFQGSLWSPQAVSLFKPPALLFPLSRLPPSPPHPPCHFPHSALAGGSSRSKIAAFTFLGWQSDKREGMNPSLIVLNLRRAQGVLGTQSHRWGYSPRVSIPLSHHPLQPPAAPAQRPPPSRLPQPPKKRNQLQSCHNFLPFSLS